MNLKAKAHLERRKAEALEKLTARVAALKEKGLEETAIQRNTVVKKVKADIRKANYRLAAIAAQEKLNTDKIRAKAEKAAAKEKPAAKPPAKAVKGGPAKKDKKQKQKTPPSAAKGEE